MILTKEKFQTELFKSLKKAHEVKIAVALIKQNIFDSIRKELPSDASQSYLIGVNLPSDISVLKQLKKESDLPNIHSKIYWNKEIYYHPKVYIVEKQNGTIDAFLGSSNATLPGFTKNVEINIKLTDPKQIKQLSEWFELVYDEGLEITEELLEEYAKAKKRVEIRERQNENDIETAIRNGKKREKTPKIKLTQDQFFKKEHYESFAPSMHNNYSASANNKRKKVKDKLEELHYRIYPKFAELGLYNLHEHYHKQNIISHYDYREGFTSKERSAIWLHYGKNKKELGKTSFVNNIRIQIIFRHDEVGVWLVLGKDCGGKEDRDYFKNKMKRDSNYRNNFYGLLSALPKDYWIEVAGRSKSISSFNTPDQLHNFTAKDHFESYFIIGKSFKPGEKSLIDRVIANSMMKEIASLYPLYEMMKNK